MQKRYVIVSGVWGVYLGQMFGYSYWTMREPAGLVAAQTFQTMRDAYNCVENGVLMPGDYALAPVRCIGTLCPLWELERAGLGGDMRPAYEEFLRHTPVCGMA